jgi:hypothetical protein
MKTSRSILILFACVFASQGEETNSASATPPPDPNVFIIDSMDKSRNALEGRCAIYRQPPDSIMFTKGSDYGRESAGLKLVYRKMNTGGPYGQGGWIGYYTTLKRGDKYFNASDYKYLTFWVRGEAGGERFKVGVADKQFAMIEDSAKSKPIESYLPDGKLTPRWQKAVIPFADMFVDYNLVDSISINFEADLFDADESNGVVYIDNIAFEKEAGATDSKSGK